MRRQLGRPSLQVPIAQALGAGSRGSMEPLGIVDFAGEQVRPGPENAESRAAEQHLLGELSEPAVHRCKLPSTEDRADLRHHPADGGPVAGREAVLDRFVRQAVRLEPAGRSAVDLSLAVWGLTAQALAQRFAEQVVVAVPVSVGVERHQEQVGALQVVERGAPPRCASNCIAKTGKKRSSAEV